MIDFAGGSAGEDKEFDLVPPSTGGSLELVGSGRPAASTRASSGSSWFVGN